jgi:ATP-dependent helicase HrpA
MLPGSGMADPRVQELQALLPRCLLPDWVRLGSRLVRLLRDRHHPASHEAVLNRLLAQAHASAELREKRQACVPPVHYPPDLPITARKDEIVATLRANQVVVIAGETGSGKTTQIPKMCLEAGLGIEAKIGCTQPRRVAALSISRRIAEELNVAWGREVGCKIRFDDRSSADTYIKLMTDGILLAETQGDPLLSEYNALILDEAHERSLNIDFLLGYLKGLLAKRTDLKLIITSATIDTAAFSRAFGDAPILEVSGRTYPVEVIYAPFDHEPDTEEPERGRPSRSNVRSPAAIEISSASVSSKLAAPGDGRTPAVADVGSAPTSPLAPDITSALHSANHDLTYIDATARVVETILCNSSAGDILIFLPGERDIRETRNLIEGRFSREAEVIPLFGRLTSGEQQRVFAASARRKIVIATNIAETSLTIPGIRYVIDSGLARLSRYSPRTRTKRLPVEPVSQSSANQRKGRAGRLQDGVCIRLYSSEDFEERPPHTQPEIQRANLAEVILRMKAFHLGAIETFPFLNPPAPAAIDNGYKLLQELGALDESRALTPLGQQLARLPIDPSLGRMLLQSQAEHATRELLIIAAGLSIQDPRERPLEQKEAAAAAHRRFDDPRSDFLALLGIWNAYHEQWENLRTQNQRRKFCQAHFLSYNRMVEWQDLHAQLEDALSEVANVKLNESNASYDAIHRSILAGLLGHVAHREERNSYKGTGNRPLAVFPGSVLFDRNERSNARGNRRGEALSSSQSDARPLPQERGNRLPPKRAPMPPTGGSAARDARALPGVRADLRSGKAPAQPQWIVAGEIVETSQVFARTVAAIDPLWIVQLAPHVCKLAHSNPHWNASQGRVLAEEKVTLQGLEIHSRKVDWGNLNAKEATEIFIRSALVEEGLFPEPSRSRGEEEAQSSGRNPTSHSLLTSAATEMDQPLPSQYRFLEHNRAIRQKISTWQTRVRRHDLRDVDQALLDFYAKRIENVSSRHELNRLLRDGSAEPNFLCVTEADLVGDTNLNYDAQAFPDSVTLDQQPVALSYAYAPGEDWDGVTVKLPVGLAQTISPSTVAWAVPGLREEQIAELLRALPRTIRRELMPLPPKVAEIARDLRPSGPSFLTDLASFIHQRFGIAVSAASWPADVLPAHLRLRIEIVGHDRKTVGAGRDLDALRQQLEKAKSAPSGETPAWARAAARWERAALTGWTFGDLPERIAVSEGNDLPVYAWPGLRVEDGHVCVRLFSSAEAARRTSLAGLQRLTELALQRDLGWLQKDLRALARFDPMLAGFMGSDELQTSAFEHLKRHILPADPLPALTQAHFHAAVEQARGRIPGAAQQLIDRLTAILPLRLEVVRRCPAPARAAAPHKLTSLGQLGVAPPVPSAPARGYATVASDLAALLPRNFLETIPLDRLSHLPRYLKALLTRCERAAQNPPKDQERSRQLAPYVDALRTLQPGPNTAVEARAKLEEFRWMIEEFKVSLFAQELGTAFPVSPKRLDQHLELLRQVLR